MTAGETGLMVTVIIVNYNARDWMPRCFESLAAQTIFSRMQVIFADNTSSDGSDQLAQELMAGWPNAVFLQTGENLGFGRACNRPVKQARGKYFPLLNPDVWLERDCLEQLVAAVGPLALNYDDDSFQSSGARRT